MDIQKILTGERIELPQMLSARENRVQKQNQLLQQYQMTLISFTLNIAGPIKVFPLAVKTYEEGLELIKYQCKAMGIPICHLEESRFATGYEGYFCVQSDAFKVKKALTELEGNSSLGRLFDIDVLDKSGQKISRTALSLPQRRCLVCGGPTFICSRSRTHSLNEILQHTISIMQDYFSEKYASQIASTAARALLYEVLATPKPGLVDKNNTGAHKDMDIITFETSSLALLPYFKAFVNFGISHCKCDPGTLLPQLRSIGIQAEIAMLRATKGINTHKGIIFSLGILETALGICYGNSISINRSVLQNLCKEIAAPMADDFSNLTEKSATTNGEKLFVHYGIHGVRGEAISGFPVLFDIAFPKMEQLLRQNYNLNDAGILTLFTILANSEDTNVISRSSYEKMAEIQHTLKEELANDLEHRDYLHFAQKLDQEFIAQNISPGGSADILALSYFLHFLKQDSNL
ncbi:MAG: triphosphoribosyl-dephospho-CoA synthase CitG [Clostridiales bacterium]|jgi:holo-ACP synthase/triphosphoribosyl-dephospho-CoA synthase|nr:triphosphoribosyl-dephospho-CoA synthase CitG [Clostridiales bacterium]MCI2161418.1 triphosphoribosyl-dephospho-CoA synthase CitG [Oscillospiraceae bacterium]MCI1962008.1 triphosphoribosyl-dephospho-CoA synthase CitG [Clostridiales bacterium]MCI2022259.1 triphosphoribosyl-dephospho-CoA synthase CitG [Clostridiales bacterium]MCI2026656.1 triphosphoribosyl-dephospho-CoA synthase CitG [Clostridiales bacterium]